MPREIVNKPHPTPNPDGPHTGTPKRGSGAEAGSIPQCADESAGDENQYDSCFDDMNVTMASVEPDPALKSKSSSDTIPRISPDSDPISSFLEDQAQQPRTSEVFQSFAPLDAAAPEPSVAQEEISAHSLIEISAGTDAMFEHSLIKTTESTTAAAHPQAVAEWGSDDDQVAESRSPWALLLLMSYSSAVTLALTWFVWTGRSFRPTGGPPANISPAEAETVPKIVSSAPLGKLPPLPEENLARLGQTIQIGELEVTPLGIALASVVLVRSIDPDDWRREEAPSLVLRLRFKNLSRDHPFTPLERRFLREQPNSLDRSTIVTSESRGINLFPLAVESEWSIEGQTFAALPPGETVETVIASESGVAEKLTDLMTWRIRLRIGTYRTDVLGVRFHKYDVAERPAE